MKKLRVSGFRSLNRIEIPAEGLVFIRGGHGAGKSSLAGAVGTALTGRNRWTDKAGKGAERQISHGAAECVIELDVAERTVARTIHARGNDLQISGISGSPTLQARAFLNELRTTREVLEVACDTSAILNATPKERADIIFSALAPKITEEDIKSLVPDAAIEGTLAEFASFPLSAAGVEKLYKSLYEARHDAKKEIERCERELAALPCEAPDHSARQKLPAFEKIRAELATRIAHAEANEETRRAIDSIGEAKTSAEEVGVTEQRAREARSTVTKLARALPQLPVKGNSAWEEVLGIADELNLIVAVKIHAEKLRILARKNGACSKAAFESAAHARAIAVAALEKSERIATEAEVKANASRTTLQRKELREALAKKITQAQPKDVQALKSKLAEVESRISTLRLMIARSDEAEQSAAIRAKTENVLNVLKTRTAILEIMVAAVSPSNRTILLEKKSGAVCRRLQAAFAALTGGRYSLVVTFDPFEICVQKSGVAASVTFDSLSGSEEYRTAVLLQDAVASLGKSPFLVIDGADILLSAELRDLLNYLKSRRDRYQAIIVTAADDGSRMLDPAWQTISLEPSQSRMPTSTMDCTRSTDMNLLI